MADGPLLTWRHEELVAEVQRLRREVHPAVVAHQARIAVLEAAVDALLQQGTFHLELIREREAALHALVDVDPLTSTDIDAFCFFCDTTARWEGSEPILDHTLDCPWIKARALLQKGDS